MDNDDKYVFVIRRLKGGGKQMLLNMSFEANWRFLTTVTFFLYFYVLLVLPKAYSLETEGYWSTQPKHFAV